MSSQPASLRHAGLLILATADGRGKAALTHSTVAQWRQGILPPGDPLPLPVRPARPARPVLLAPRDMPKRRAGGAIARRIALLHALAHIELNALDLVWDLIARFPPVDAGYDDDWVRVAAEEARHFELVLDRLMALGAEYGDLPAHNGLWQAAEATASDLLARLAVVPMVLEARGLDVTPAMINTLEASGDRESAQVLKIIYNDEIGHVGVGRRWFEAACAARNLEPILTWRGLVRRYFKGALKPPFNAAARQVAGLVEDYYLDLVSAG